MYDDDQMSDDEISNDDLLDGNKRSKKLPIDDDMVDALDEDDLADVEDDADEEDM